MTFNILVLPDLLKNLPPNFKDNIKAAIKELIIPFPGTGKGEKKEIKGANNVAYRLRVGSFRIFYRIDKDNRRLSQNSPKSTNYHF
ncbi:MAG TPA: type II toxin-antitoxin system RelE/ParE family toxin [Methanosarcinaceae archaeon]|nr:type II toxin-antitoxin system RelE/ParE family toxin [Methanosarcinaceae archaeon]